MKTKIFISIAVVVLLCCCSDNVSPTKFSFNNLELAFQFNTISNPNSLILDEENQFIYTCGTDYHSNAGSKIVQYNLDGTLHSTIADFSYFNSGKYLKYFVYDITLDNELNICALVKPYYKNEGTEDWFPYNGFCIISFNSNGKFICELDFSSVDVFITPQTIAFHNDTFYLTNSISLFKISKTSHELTEINLTNSSGSTFPEYLISDISFNNDGEIWVTGQIFVDSIGLGTYVCKVDSDFNQLTKFNSISHTEFFGAGIGQPGLTFDDYGNIFLVTFYCKSFEVYNKNGELLGNYDLSVKIDSRILPNDIEIYRSKFIYILDTNNGIVYVFKERSFRNL